MLTRPRRIARALATLVAIAATVGGCGGGTSTGTPAHVVGLSADPTGALNFTTSTASSPAGNVELIMSNPSTVAHGIAIQGAGVNSFGAVVGQGGTSTITATLKPGAYTFYCPVPGHRQAGMHGTLTVR
jgi:plastocyanin